ncbi:sulfatase family protein [Auraticoccus monumenti]|uniref:Arylsulfatase A n=1 Tax=Auraticoccus monumenti TaxID=675864 RepID=A0A1G6Y5T6_9ACTN|nr:sulfatase-like hydrolase/transferase [Auraticoccus monumenti]SDD85067.1 Arylsulfatase A [Auraticoccus monumenti]
MSASRLHSTPAAPASPDATRERPNIVFVITDQQRFDTIAALGHDHVDTPNLDRLVAEGAALTRTYVTSPSCAPSRASLFSGLFPHTTGVLRNDEPWHHSWVERLGEAGYHCVNVGKMHTYPYEASVGFHERHVVENKDRDTPRLPFYLDTWDKALWARGVRKPSRVTYAEREDYTERLGAFEWEPPADLHADTFVGSLAAMWLERWRGDRPFFLQVGFPGPHPPYDPTPQALDAYRDRDVPLPSRSPEEIAAQPQALQDLRAQHMGVDHDAIVHLDEPTEEQLLRQRRHYHANVTMIDEQIGVLRDALAARGVLDDTVIIFTSDHGDTLNDHGHSQKWTMYEGSVHVPAVVWGPGRIAAGQVLDGLTSHMDLGPTVLELAGVEVPSWFEARSLLPALRGEEYPGRPEVFSEHARDRILSGTALMTMVVRDRWKLVSYLDPDDGQLFDLEADPGELHDLYDEAEHAPVRAELESAIHRWRAESQLRTAAWSEQFR